MGEVEKYIWNVWKWKLISTMMYIGAWRLSSINIKLENISN